MQTLIHRGPAQALALALVFVAGCENQITQPLARLNAPEAIDADKAPFKSVYALDPLPGTIASYSVGYAINDLNQAVGMSSSDDGDRAVIWDNSTVPQNLGVLPGHLQSYAVGISNDGRVIAGTSESSGIVRPVRWVKSNGQWLIDALPATTNCYSTGISSDGTAISAICGAKAVVYLNGSLIELGDGEVNGVNSKGQAVGNSIGGSHALMWSFSSGSVTQKDLGTLGGSWVTARAINDAGEVLGTSANAQQIFHAFLWSPKKKTMTDLTPDARSFDGGGINAAGQGAGDLFDGASHAAFFDHGKIVDLGILPGYKAAIARGLNNAGRVIGHSFGTTAVTRATVWVLK